MEAVLGRALGTTQTVPFFQVEALQCAVRFQASFSWASSCIDAFSG